ncbi:alpha/beta fold hydrolase [Actinoplanes solisilvae]|uniref:alpha/beta fold hydrolase n=1 Tax=Actinoplanes solisilvae TaxID=2486853 RepID=UPI000FDBAB09|nr:alpha/beta hydrolase [Actinoplanes solisilvae]
MKPSADPILFLSGAGLAAWIWDDVRRDLAGSRQTLVAVRPTNDRARLADYARAAVDSAPPGRFAIVAHSSGGVIGSEIVRQTPDRVSAFLALTAVIPSPGESFLSAMPRPTRWLLNAAMRLAGTRPPDSAVRRGIAHGLNERVADHIVTDFTPESPHLYRDRTTPGEWTAPRGYLHTTKDRELPIALQRQCAKNLGTAWQDELNTGHLPMLEDHRSVAGSITRFLNHALLAGTP